MLYILQWNARSLVANGQKLKRFADAFEDKPDLMGVQETWLKPCLDFVIAGYENVRIDRANRTGGGCTIFVKKGLQFKGIEINTEIECVAVKVWSTHGRISVINIYNPGLQLKTKQLENLKNTTEKPVIWVGDFTG